MERVEAEVASAAEVVVTSMVGLGSMAGASPTDSSSSSPRWTLARLAGTSRLQSAQPTPLVWRHPQLPEDPTKARLVLNDGAKAASLESVLSQGGSAFTELEGARSDFVRGLQAVDQALRALGEGLMPLDQVRISKHSVHVVAHRVGSD